MADLGLADVLSLAQTIGIVGTMIITLYFSTRITKSLAVDVETRVLNDLDEKIHGFAEIMLDRPQMLKVIYNQPSTFTQEVVVSYYVMFICSHVYHMRQRKVLRDNEWAGWLQWMKNAFQFGTMEKDWRELEMGRWFDPAFRNFVDNEMISSQAKA